MIDIIEECKGAGSIGISGHLRPDGDCVGSCLGMYLYLKKNCPAETVIDVILEPFSNDFNCIKGAEDRRDYPRRQPYDVFICLDCDEERLGDSRPGFDKAKKTINIDHHVSNQSNADVKIVEPEAAAASELVFLTMDKDKMDVDIAMALYVGIINDTGVLQYSNASPRTHRIVADLLEFGFDHSKFIDETFYEKSYIQNQILGRALTESMLVLDKKVIAAAIDRKIMNFYGVTGKDMDGIVSQLRYTRGVEVAILMYELESQKWKVSLRSNGKVNVAEVAEFFDGGGHVRASGCTLLGDYRDVINNLCDRIALQL